MSYPPPPGLSSNGTSSLPPRPPQPAKASSRNAAPAPFTGFAPRAVAAQSAGFRSAHSAAGAPHASAYHAGTAPATGANASFQNFPGQHQAQPQQAGAYEYAAAPQIRNPFAPPTHGGGQHHVGPAYDPELEAQIAQWQSAYVPRDDRRGGASGAYNTGSNAVPLGHSGLAGATAGPAREPLSAADVQNAAPADSGVASVITGADGKQTTVVRSGGGKTWQDSSLLEWNPAHFRIFVGNLAGEVTDESLFKAFVKFASVQKARVVRDKRTTKSKGYGFVSFADGDDYFQAAREMQGKYIGSHPVLIKKSTTDIKASTPKEKREGKKGAKHSARNAGSGVGAVGPARDTSAYASAHAAGANTGAGVHKKHGKTKNGLKILG